MPREIKYRGLRADGQGWVYGDLIHTPENTIRIIGFDLYKSDEIIDYKDFNYQVIKESVGEFTGLTDKNGVEVFEGDIILVNYGSHKMKETVVFNNAAFKKSYLGDENEIHLINFTSKSSQNIEVIGNIHEIDVSK